MLKVRNLACMRDDRPLFSPLNFEVTWGELVLITGANGTGKTSLLRVVAGLSTSHTGTITWQQRPLFKASAVYKSLLHYVGHQNGLQQHLSVIENIKLASLLHTHTAIVQDEILSALQLEKHRNQSVGTLSLGQKRKVALAILLQSQKKIWLLDEPLTGLDDITQQLMLHYINKHLAHGGWVMMASHHPLSLPAARLLQLQPC